MKYLLFSIALIACANEPISNTEIALAVETTNETMESKSFYDLSATTIDGADFSFSALKGKRVLIVNVASKCGYTPQYEELQQLHERYGGEKFCNSWVPSE
jgi:glutathione peroxidase